MSSDGVVGRLKTACFAGCGESRIALPFARVATYAVPLLFLASFFLAPVTTAEPGMGTGIVPNGSTIHATITPQPDQVGVVYGGEINIGNNTSSSPGLAVLSGSNGSIPLQILNDSEMYGGNGTLYLAKLVSSGNITGSGEGKLTVIYESGPEPGQQPAGEAYAEPPYIVYTAPPLPVETGEGNLGGEGTYRVPASEAVGPPDVAGVEPAVMEECIRITSNLISEIIQSLAGQS